MRKWLKDMREQNGETMKSLARKLDISESYYCAIENGNRQKKMDIALVAGLSTALGVSIDRIMRFEAEYKALQESNSITSDVPIS